MVIGDRLLWVGFSTVVAATFTACADAPALSEAEVVNTVEAAILESLGSPPYKHPFGNVEALCVESPPVPQLYGEHQSGEDEIYVYPLTSLTSEVLDELRARLSEVTGLRIHDISGCGGWLPDDDSRGIHEREDGAPALLIELFQPTVAKSGGHLVQLAVVAGWLWGWVDRCVVSTGVPTECTRVLTE